MKDRFRNPRKRIQANIQSKKLEEVDHPNDKSPSNKFMQPTEVATQAQPDDLVMFTTDRTIAH